MKLLQKQYQQYGGLSLVVCCGWFYFAITLEAQCMRSKNLFLTFAISIKKALFETTGAEIFYTIFCCRKFIPQSFHLPHS